jgi:hypothetical protein
MGGRLQKRSLVVGASACLAVMPLLVIQPCRYAPTVPQEADPQGFCEPQYHIALTYVSRK